MATRKTYAKKDSGGHWYRSNGESAHDADLRIARKERLFPSITSVDKDQFVNIGLDIWKRNEIVVACVDNPRQPHETIDDYGDRIFKLSGEKARIAADKGKKIHDAFNEYPQLTTDREVRPWVEAFDSFYRACIGNKIASEETLIDTDLGLAGKCDFIGRGNGCYPFTDKIIMPDWKTQDVKRKKNGEPDPQFYDSWCRQLSFYAVAYAKRSGMWPEIPLCASVVFDSNEAREPFLKIWSDEEVVSAYHDVVVAVNCWCKKRDYWPVGRWNLFHALPTVVRPNGIPEAREAALDQAWPSPPISPVLSGAAQGHGIMLDQPMHFNSVAAMPAQAVQFPAGAVNFGGPNGPAINFNQNPQ